jgi:hypothetical protein
MMYKPFPRIRNFEDSVLTYSCDSFIFDSIDTDKSTIVVNLGSIDSDVIF